MVTLSVITVVLNGRRFIANALERASREIPYDGEHLIVDGGSTDGTIESIETFSKQDPRVKLVLAKGTNQAAAMNIGILAARGEIIGFLNVDDYYEPGAIIVALDSIKKITFPGFVWGRCRMKWLDGEPRESISYGKFSSCFEILSDPYLTTHPQNPATYFYHKDLHNRFGLYDEQLTYSFDLDFLLSICGKTSSYQIDEILGCFCLHSDSKTIQDQRKPKYKSEVRRVLLRHFMRLPLHKKIPCIFIHVRNRFFRKISSNT